MVATLTLTHASLATVDELFRYKAAGFTLPPFPGYTPDQWGIKAHNRPWVDEAGRWATGQRILEVGGAYSRLPGGLELHAIDIPVGPPRVVAAQWLAEKLPPLRLVRRSFGHDIAGWIRRFERTGVRIAVPIPSIGRLLDRTILVESPDVVYRFYPPNDAVKSYRPAASLLLVIERDR